MKPEGSAGAQRWKDLLQRAALPVAVVGGLLGSCLVFSLRPPPDYAEFVKKDKAGRYRALLYRLYRFDDLGAVVELGSRDPKLRDPPPAFLEPNKVVNVVAVLPFRLFVSNPEAVSQRLGRIKRDTSGVRALQDYDIEEILEQEGGELLWPIMDLELGEDEDRPRPPPRRVVVRIAPTGRPYSMVSELTFER